MTNDTTRISEDHSLENSGVFKVGFFTRHVCAQCEGEVHELHAEKSEVYAGHYCPGCLRSKMEERIADMTMYVNGGEW